MNQLGHVCFLSLPTCPEETYKKIKGLRPINNPLIYLVYGLVTLRLFSAALYTACEMWRMLFSLVKVVQNMYDKYKFVLVMTYGAETIRQIQPRP